MKKVMIFTVLITVINSYILGCFAYAAFSKDEATTIYSATSVSELTSKAYAIVDGSDGIVLANKNGDVRYSVGNMIKLMTLYLTFEAIGQELVTMDTEFKVTKHAQAVSEGRARVFLDAGKGERIRIEQAIEAVCIASANDAACALAEFLGGSEAVFVERMNQKAAELGMTNTLFADSTGIITEGQYTSANDMAILSFHLVTKYPAVLEYTKLTYGTFDHYSTSQEASIMVSSNNLIRGKFYTESDGLLVGYSNADGYSQAATVAENGSRVFAVLIGAQDENYRAAELKRVMKYGLSGFEKRTIVEAGTMVRRIDIIDGKETKIKTETVSSFEVTLNKNDFANITSEVVIDSQIKAPVAKGEVVGKIVYKLEDEEIGSVDIVTSEDMERANWFTRLIRRILAWLGLD